MKAIIILPLACSLFFFMRINELSAQAPAKNIAHNLAYAPSAGRGVVALSSEKAPLLINAKIQKHFAINFSDVSAQKWSMAGNKFYCKFYLDGLPACALFAKNGQLIYTITYGTEINLPAEIRKIVKREYYDYTIDYAREVKQNRRDVWIVIMKNNSLHKTVRIENGEMELIEQFTESVH